MKKEVSPAVAIAVVVVIIAVVGFFLIHKTASGSGSSADIEKTIQAGVSNGPAQGNAMPNSGAPR